MLMTHDLYFQDDYHTMDNRRFKSSKWDNTYPTRMNEIYQSFSSGTPISNVSYSTRFGAKEQQVLNSSAQANKLYDIVTNKSGSIYSFDTETIGNTLDLLNGESYATITEFGISKLENGKKDLTSVAFGLNKEQGLDAADLIDKWVKSGFDETQFTGNQLSTLDRISRYAGSTNMIGKREIDGVGNVAIVRGLSDSNIYKESVLYQGLGNLMAIGGVTKEELPLNNANAKFSKYVSTMESHMKKLNIAPQRIGDTYGNQIFQNLIDFVKNKSEDTSSAVTGYNFNYDMVTMRNQANKYGLDFKLTDADYVDPYYAILSMAKNGAISENSPLGVAKKIAGYSDIDFDARHPGTLETFAEINGIQISAHHAGSDSSATGMLASMDDFIDGKSFPSLLKETIDSLNGKRDTIFNPLQNNGSYRPVLYANNAMLRNERDYAYSIVNGEMEVNPHYLEYGLTRGNVYEVKEIRQLNDGYMVDYRSASKKGQHGMIKYYSSLEEIENSMSNDFTSMYTGSRIPGKNSPIRDMFISEKDIELQRTVWEADTARRKFEGFFDSAWTSLSEKGKNYDGFEEGKRYYKILEEVQGKGIDVSKKKTRRAIQEGDFDDVIGEIVKENGGSNATLRNFKNMTGQLISEKPIFAEISSYLSDKENLSNFEKTIIAENYRNSILQELKSEKDMTVATSISKSESLWKSATVKDLMDWDVSLDGKYTRVSIGTGEAFARDIMKQANRIAKQSFPDRIKSSFGFGGPRNLQKDVEAFRVLRQFTVDNIVNNDKVPLNNKENILKLFDQAKGNVTGTSNYALASQLGSILEENKLTVNTSNIGLKVFKDLGLGREGSAAGVSTKSIDFFMNKNVILDTAGFSHINIAGNVSSNMLNGLKYTFGNRSTALNLGEYAAGSKLLENKINIMDDTYRNMRSSFNLRQDLNSPDSTFYKTFKESMGFTDENMRTFSQALYYSPSNNGKSKGGIDALRPGENQTDYFSSLILSEDGNKAYVVSTKTEKAQEIISILNDVTKGEQEKIDLLRGTGDYLPTQAKAVVWEINGINRRGNQSITPEGLLNSDSSVVQGKNGYERIVKNYISKFESKGEVTLKFQNNFDDIIKTLLLRKESVKEMIDNNEYYRGTRLLERGANDKLKDMSAYSGYQTMTVNGVPQRVRVPNAADLLQSQEIKGIEVLKDMVFEFAGTGKEGDKNQYMREILSKFALNKDNQKGYLNPANIRNMYESKDYDAVALEDFFTRHLFHGNFSDEMDNYHTDYKGTFIDFLNENKTEKTSDVISYLYNNKDALSQIVKETAATEGYFSMVNKMEYDMYGNLAATQRPTNIQELAMMWYDKKSAKEYYDVDSLTSRDITFGNIVENQKMKELKTEYQTEIGAKINVPTEQLEQNMTGYVKQMSDLEIAQAYNRIDNVDLAANISRYSNVSDSSHRSMVSAMDEIFRDTFASTYESAEFVLPVFANQDHFSSGEIHTIHRRPINELSKTALENNLKKTGGILRKGDFIGYDNKNKKMFYDGPEGILTNLDEYAETGELKILPSRIETGSIKLGHYAEKATGHTIRFDEKDKRFASFIVRNEQGDVDLTATNQLINHYSSEYFYQLTGDRKSVIAANMALGKHTSGDVVYGGFLNRLSLEYQKTGNRDGFNSLMKQFGLADYLHYNSDGTILNKVSDAPKPVMNYVDDLYTYLKDNVGMQKEFGATIANYADDIANNRVLTGIARTKLQDTLGDIVSINDKMAQILRLAGKDTLGVEGLTDKNSVLLKDGTRKMYGDYIADLLTVDRKLTPAEMGARKTVQGVKTALEYALNPEELVGTTKAVKINIGDVYIPRSGSKFEELSESFLMTDGKVSDFIKSKANNAFIDDINVAVLDLSEFKKGLSYDLGNAKGLTSVVVPLIDMTPVKGEVVYTPMQSSINHMIETIQNTNSQEEIQKAIENMYSTFAREISGSTDSYMNKKVIKAIHRNGAQIQAQRSITNVMNFLVNNPDIAEDKNSMDLIAKAIGKATTEGMGALHGLDLNGKEYNLTLKDISLYDTRRKKMMGYQGNYMRVIDNKLQLDNVVEFSEKAMQDAFGVNFEQIGRDVIKNISNPDAISTMDNLKVTSEMLDSYRNQMDTVLSSLGFKLTEAELQASNLMNTVTTKLAAKEINSLANTLGSGKSYLLELAEDIVDVKNNRDFSTIMKIAKSEFRNYTKGRYSNSEVDDIFYGIENKILNAKALMKHSYGEVGKMYLEQYGIFGNTTRHPTFNEGHSGIVMYRLNRTLEGQSSIQVPWLAEIEKLDYDADTKFDIPFLNKKGGLLLKGKDDTTIKALNGLYQDLSSRQGFYYAKQVKSMTKAEQANILDLEYKFAMLSKWGINKEYGGVFYTENDINDLIKAARQGDETATSTLTSLTREWVKDYGNMIKNEEVIMSSIKAKVTKGNIGYISNVNYALRDSLLGSYNEILEKGEDPTLLNQIKKDLSTPGLNLLNVTEQEGIDTKHVFDALGTAETAKYQKAITSLMTSKDAPSEAIKRNALSNIYDAVGKKLFNNDVLKEIPLDKTKAPKGQIVDRILSLNYEDLSERERWLKSLLNLSENKTARKSFNSILATGKFSKKKGINEFIDALVKKDSLLSGTRAGHVIAHTNTGEIERVGYKMGDRFISLDKSNLYVEDNLGYALKEMRTKNGVYTASFDVYNLGGSSGRLDYKNSEKLSARSVQELNDQLQKKFGSFQGFSKVGMSRNAEYRSNTLNEIANKHASLFIKKVTRNIDDYKAPTLNEIDNVFLKRNMKISQFMDNVSKKDLRKYNRRINYITENKIPLVNNRGFADSVQMHSVLLDEINQAILMDGANAKTFATDHGFNNVFDYYFDKMVTPLSNIPDVLDDKYKAKSSASFEDIVADYRKNSYNIEKAQDKINELYLNTVKEKASANTDAIINTEINRLKGLNEAAQQKAFSKLSSMVDPTNIDKSLRGILNPDQTFGGSTIGYGKYFGENISSLGKDALREIMEMDVDTDNEVLKSVIQLAKSDASAILNPSEASSVIGGSLEYGNQDSISLIRKLNDQIIEEGKNTASAMGDAKAASSETAGKVISKTLSATDDLKSMMSGKGKIVGYTLAGLAALGLGSQMLHRDKSTPLAPDQTPSGETTVRKMNIKNAKNSHFGKTKTIYDSGNNVGINISAKGARKLNHRQMAQMVGNTQNSSVDVHTYDDTSQVSNNWLERKFSELM